MRKLIDKCGRAVEDLAEGLLLLANPLCDLAAMVVSVVLIALGLLCMARGVVQFAPELLKASSEADGGRATMGWMLAGLEFLFLAPLPFALSRAIWIWMPEISAQVHGEGAPAEMRAENAVTNIKSSTLLLMAGVVATEMVDLTTGARGMSYEAVFCGVALIGVLVLAAWVVRTRFSGASN